VSRGRCIFNIDYYWEQADGLLLPKISTVITSTGVLQSLDIVELGEELHAGIHALEQIFSLRIGITRTQENGNLIIRSDD